MAIMMYKGKDSKVVDNRDVRQHRRDGWVYHKPSQTETQKKVSRPRKPRATLKVKDVEVVQPKTNIDLPDPEDLNINIEE